MHSVALFANTYYYSANCINLLLLNWSYSHVIGYSDRPTSGKSTERKSPKYTNDELKKFANEFPELRTVVGDQGDYHQGTTDEYQSVTDDLEPGSTDKPTAIERVRAQGEK
ncbi:hypothetical protein TRIATDRAFT_85900 [Trichoderma atroviride IMI 206040]|uniref:Uncharacterized protein n=1 Tax=Hypocrea atroviridis (strain ATCC 20476 / IMI 206040) TaxID=452589 RepID=G9P191_HYPAI|nr:uncharacterized protein TRIATDRAFT_85900 [Trichoderma atroviride IMI 206040]EHK43279.1 hypothetical protein TRIATDRAFT_85900 [Trichoderma atroviride IMI 206040]